MIYNRISNLIPFSRFGLILLAFSTQSIADIVGGDEVGPKDPIQNSVVGVYEPSRDGQGGSLCTASLIGKNVAITAAHCIHPNSPKPTVIFGRNLHSPEVHKRPVTGVKINPKWKDHAGQGMDQGDIAIIKFKGPTPPGYQPTEIVDPKTKLRKGRVAIVSGFGISNARDRTGAGILRKTKVKIINPRLGKKEMIIDQSGGSGACHGDSGGPAFIRQRGKTVLAGVTNRSYPNHAPDDCAHSAVFTKVGAYKRWIRKSEKALRSETNGNMHSVHERKILKRSKPLKHSRHARPNKKQTKGPRLG